ncbi:PIN domain-containing protein [Sphaerimonospora cavernae]|uniref:PIN domain-containing protein n=1 Tax=Sphaerimonospora cavernae TaxID=1740611 RepID=A0ABV6TXK8_9ACTN
MPVKLPPGGNRENALKALQDVYSRVSEVRRSGTLDLHSQQFHAAYLNWVDNAVYILRHHISAEDLDQLVLTRRYWTLQAMNGSSLPPDRMRELIATELEDREIGLGLAAQRLAEQIERWSRSGVFVVPDTSFFIHHDDKVEDLDLAGLLQLRDEPIHLLVPMVVVDELDDLKQSKDRHTRWRARHTLAVLDRLLSNRHRPRNSGPRTIHP